MFVSTINPIIDYDFVIKKDEGQYFDRKSFAIKPSQLADHIIGMANAQGGVLAVGIKNEKLDYKKDMLSHKYNDFFQVMQDYIHPHPRVKIETIEIEKKKLLIYHIDTSVENFFERKDNQKVFLRVGDETKELNHYEIDNLKYDKELRTFEDTTCKDFNISEFRDSLIVHYKEKIKFKGSNSELMVYRNLAKIIEGKTIYNNSAILLFAENPDKHIPSSYIRYVRYDGSFEKTGAEFNVIKDERFEGPIPIQIEKAKRFLGNVLKEYVYLDIQSGRFQETLEFPEEARLEGIVNAVTHRSYNRQGNPILIKHYDNRIEISNAGPLPSNVTIENIRTTRYSRNPRIARVLYELGYVRELNEGVKRIYSSMEKALLGDPVYQDKNSVITLTLINNVQKHSKTFDGSTFDKIHEKFKFLSEKEKKIVVYLFKEGKGKTKDIEKELGLTRSPVLRYLKSLVEKGLIKRMGKSETDPNSFYTFA